MHLSIKHILIISKPIKLCSLLPQRSLNPVQDLQMRIVTEESSKKRKLSVIEEEAQQGNILFIIRIIRIIRITIIIYYLWLFFYYFIIYDYFLLFYYLSFYYLSLEEENRLYRAVVGQAMSPLRETTDDIIHRLNSTPTKSSKRLLSFSTPTKERNYFFDSPVKRDYNSSPLPLEAQLILTSPRKPPRYISRTPYKVLDAPDLQVCLA